MNSLSTILQQNLSKRNTQLDGTQTSACLEAMYQFATLQVERYRRQELYDTVGLSVRLYPRMLCQTFILWLRKLMFVQACRQAQLKADTENYKVYVILSSMVGYTLLSTREVDYNKKIRILGANVSAKELSSKSAYIAYPTKRLWNKKPC